VNLSCLIVFFSITGISGGNIFYFFLFWVTQKNILKAFNKIREEFLQQNVMVSRLQRNRQQATTRGSFFYVFHHWIIMEKKTNDNGLYNIFFSHFLNLSSSAFFLHPHFVSFFIIFFFFFFFWKISISTFHLFSS
jgi:hypothetical protein